MKGHWVMWETRYVLSEAADAEEKGVDVDLNKLDKKIQRGTAAIDINLRRWENAAMAIEFDSAKHDGRVVERMNERRAILKELGYVLTPSNVEIAYDDITWHEGPAHGDSTAPRVNERTNAINPKGRYNIVRADQQWKQAFVFAKENRNFAAVYGQFCAARASRGERVVAVETYRRYLNGWPKGNAPYTNPHNSAFVRDVVQIVESMR